ncbi:MAG: PQQ-dependent sugar dehydrogenase [Pseudomonadota bacterium]|nr:PQQ-dependent sugar dehydrogenase [Pseudomonadota bacterium]
MRIPHVRPLASLVSAFTLCCSATAFAQSSGVVTTVMGTFNEPWAIEFLPDSRALVTEKGGSLKLLAGQNQIYDITGEPLVAYGGQGGLGDVVLHPDFATNGIVYLSYAEAGSDNTRGAAVARARLDLTATGGALSDLQVIWRQVPKTTGSNHYSHRIAFDGDGYLWITSGERQLGTPAQQMDTNLGKIVRLHDDGTVPSDNPFASMGGVAAEIWSLGHRNVLGLAFDELGRLWDVEMGPQGGDELNLIERGENYGWPLVSNGRNYNSPVDDIPDHSTSTEFRAPWGSTGDSRVISPSSLMFYSGSHFPEWQGDAFISGLTNRTVSRIEFTSVDSLREAYRWTFPARVRAVEQGPEGGIWLLEDGAGARLIRYTAP